MKNKDGPLFPRRADVRHVREGMLEVKSPNLKCAKYFKKPICQIFSRQIFQLYRTIVLLVVTSHKLLCTFYTYVTNILSSISLYSMLDSSKGCHGSAKTSKQAKYPLKLLPVLAHFTINSNPPYLFLEMLSILVLIYGVASVPVPGLNILLLEYRYQ